MIQEPYDNDDEDDSDQRSFLRRHRVALIGGVAVFGLAGTAIFHIVTGHGSAPHKEADMVMVKLPPMPTPPPPAPTPPPPEPEVPQEKMMEQEPAPDDEKKPEPPKPEQPPAALSTNNVGGPGDGFGLVAGNNNGMIGGSGSGQGSGAHSRFGWYAGQVQSKIGDALRANKRTRGADLRLEVRIWPDLTGRVTRAKISGSTGDPALDAAIQSEVLTGLQLQEPPPEGMPLPIVMRIIARRPGGGAAKTP